MKRKIFIALAVGAFAMASCKKVEAPEPAPAGSATIQGVISADIEQIADTVLGGFYVPQQTVEYPPAGTIITFQTSAANLDPTPSGGAYETLSWTTTISSTDGSFSIDVPAINAPYNIDVLYNEFADDYYAFATQDTTVGQKFGLANETLASPIFDGAVVIMNRMYTAL